ncbi:MAG TPA: hypothetical protein VGQ92_22765 [Actinoplanes sp.]|nr:hypothetical protein [Actinoplanes sp.]
MQAVLLEYGKDLDPMIVAACLPVWSDRDLGGPEDLPAVARLQTLRRWAKRYPELADQARSARTSAGRDAARALRDGEQWELVDELVQFTTDPQILADAVENVAGFVQELIVDRDRSIERTLEVDQAVKATGTALVTLATCPHTPDEALRAALPLAASHVTVDEIAAARPSLAQDCAAERLSRTGMFLRQPQLVENLVDVPDDQALAATGDPAAALMSYLPYLQDADRQQRARLATRLLQSRHVTSDVLLALPGEVVSASPWHAALAAAMVTEVCRDDPQRWSVLHLQLPGRDPLTFGGVLAELRDYEPPRTVTYGAQAGYRYCHACHLVTPHEWPPVPRRSRAAT